MNTQRVEGRVERSRGMETLIPDSKYWLRSIRPADPLRLSKQSIRFLIRFFGVYHESIKRELMRRLIHEFRCIERLKAKAEGSTRLTYIGITRGTGTPENRNEVNR
jgi:hypothetical protein